MRLLLTILMLLLALPAAADQGLGQRLEALDSRVAAEPTSIDLRVIRADLRHRAGMPIEALTDLAVVREEQPTEPRMLLIRARIHQQLGSPDLALADLDLRIASGPPSAEAHSLRSRIRELAGELAGSLEDAGHALRLSPSPERALDRARLLETSSGPLAAAEACARSADELGGAVVLRLHAVRSFREAGQPARGLEQVQALLASSPGHPDWLVLQAEVLDETGRHSEALAARRQALARLEELLSLRPTRARRAAHARLTAQIMESP